MRRGFVRRLPRPVRWLWFAILAVIAAECVGVVLGLFLGQAWAWTAIQLSSVLAGPVAVGLLIVVVAAAFSRRGADAERAPAQSSNPQVPLEVAAGRAAGQAVAAFTRSREGKAAIRQTSRLVRAIRAGVQAPPGAADPERQAGKGSGGASE